MGSDTNHIDTGCYITNQNNVLCGVENRQHVHHMWRNKFIVPLVALMAWGTGQLVAQTNTFILRGKLTQWKGSDTLALHYRIGPKRDTTIHIPIIDGRFRYEGTSVVPLRTELRDGRDHRQPHAVDRAIVFVEPGKATRLKGTGTLADASVRGTTAQREFNGMVRLLARYNRKLVLWRKELAARAQADNGRATPRYRALKARFDWRADRRNARLFDFVRQHPESIVSLDVLFTFITDIARITEVQKLYDGLDPQVRATPFGREVGKKLDAIQATAPSALQAPHFSSVTPEGDTLTMHGLLVGKRLLLLTFWASWSEPSLQEQEALRTAYNNFSRIGFEIVGVSLDKDNADWRRAIANRELNWPQVSGLKGWDEPIAKLYGVYAIPAHIFIDGNGEVVGSGLRAGAIYDFVRDYLATH